jgi:Domain of unknown function (DUF4412)
MKPKFAILILLSLCFNISTNAQAKQKMMESIMGKGKPGKSKLPDAYQFQWKFKTIIKTSNSQEMNMDYLINPDTTYFGMQMSGKEYQQMDFMCIVVDPKIETSTTFMNSKGQKMAMLGKLPKEGTKKEKEQKMSFKEIGTKEILGYECDGIEVENADYIGTMYFTLDAPVSFSALFAFSKKSTPKGFDPALLEVLEEDALLMEMNFENKKKKKESFTMTAVSLEQEETTIKTSDYQVMPGL